MKQLIKHLLREGLNNDFYSKIIEDVKNSDSFNTLFTKVSKYPENEKRIFIELYTKFCGGPEDNYKRNGRVILYHGTPDDIDTFRLTKGVRSTGVLGGNTEVDNLGVFLTDNKKLADFFGNNRAEGKYTSRYNTYTVYVDLGRVLDSQNIPPNLKKIANLELYNYHGKRQNISPTNFWWLLDNPEFINEVKKSYDTIVFDEQKKVFKLANLNSGRTYFILDPNRIEKYEPLTFNELKNNIESYIEIFKKLY
jgi:uncharacterized protein YbcV (DUF1398 family)